MNNNSFEDTVNCIKQLCSEEKQLIPHYVLAGSISVEKVNEIKQSISDALGYDNVITLEYSGKQELAEFLAERLFYAAVELYQNKYRGIVEVRCDCTSRELMTGIREDYDYIVKLAENSRILFILPEAEESEDIISPIGFELIFEKGNSAADYIINELDLPPDILNDIADGIKNPVAAQQFIKQIRYIRAAGGGDEDIAEIVMRLKRQIGQKDRYIGFAGKKEDKYLAPIENNDRRRK